MSDRTTRAWGRHRPSESLCIVTRKDGHWGVRARSSDAGIAVKGSAF